MPIFTKANKPCVFYFAKLAKFVWQFILVCQELALVWQDEKPCDLFFLKKNSVQFSFFCNSELFHGNMLETKGFFMHLAKLWVAEPTFPYDVCVKLVYFCLMGTS